MNERENESWEEAREAEDYAARLEEEERTRVSRSAGSTGVAAARATASRGRRLVQRLGIPLVVLIVLAVLFALQNLTRVTISIWTIKVVSPLWISLYFWLIVGGVIGYVAGRAVERRPKR
jgi:uncharacterized integral membrane protein